MLRTANVILRRSSEFLSEEYFRKQNYGAFERIHRENFQSIPRGTTEEYVDIFKLSPRISLEIKLKLPSVSPGLHGIHREISFYFFQWILQAGIFSGFFSKTLS